jgi:hypothetical protein
MTKKNIIIAIAGGAVVGALGAAGIVFPDYGALCVSAAAIVTTVVAMITGFQIKGA